VNAASASLSRNQWQRPAQPPGKRKRTASLLERLTLLINAELASAWVQQAVAWPFGLMLASSVVQRMAEKAASALMSLMLLTMVASSFDRKPSARCYLFGGQKVEQTPDEPSTILPSTSRWARCVREQRKGVSSVFA